MLGWSRLNRRRPLCCCYWALLLPSTTATRAMSSSTTRSPTTKQLWILRHGQATHNPRAERARENGCSHQEFLELMRQDDSLDAPLTELGQEQARSVTLPHELVQAVVSSPLSRALHTADLACPTNTVATRICHEPFREINGWLLNAQRRTKSELQARFPHWSFDELSTEHDVLWTDTLEAQEECAQRGQLGLRYLHDRPESSLLLVCHGGLLRFTFATLTLRDGRQQSANGRFVSARFSNCELRRYTLDVVDDEIILTEVDL